MAYVVSIGEQDQEKQNRSIRNAHERATTIEADLDTLEAAAVTATNAFGTDGRVLISDGTGRKAEASLIAADSSGNITSFGGNIAFPATQAASADANTLDDYEEGTWTPQITFATPGDLAVTYSVQDGSYTKIGRLVVIDFNLVTSAFTHTTAAGSLRVTGVPFNAGSNIFGGNFSWSGITKAGYTQIAFQIVSAGGLLVFNASGSGLAQAQVLVADMPTGGEVVVRGLAAYRV
jgi:hypothetical protein